MSIALILAFTLVARMLELTQWGDGELSASWLTDNALWGESVHIDRPWILNAVLFIPAGFTLARSCHVWISVAALAALSVVIELTQRRLMLGAPDPADLVANVVGATVGALAARVTPRVLRLSPS
jgi:glycopeptide antibiotics resistance protein